MKEYQISYQTKLKQLKKQYKLYDDFLVQEKINTKNRHKLINEMGRVSVLITKINEMIVGDFLLSTDDYFERIESKMNN